MAWAKRHASKFDPLKYQLVHLSRKKNAELHMDLALSHSHTIKAKTSGVLLGVEIDNDLKWKQHVERIKMKAITSISAQSNLAGSVWGGRLKTVQALYQASDTSDYILPGLPDHNKYILKSFQTIQGRASRVITGAFTATSLQALDIETFLLPVTLRLDKLGSESLLRIASNQLYETIINKRPKPARLEQLSL